MVTKSERRAAKREQAIRGHKTSGRGVQLLQRLQVERAEGLRSTSTPKVRTRGRKKKRQR